MSTTDHGLVVVILSKSEMVAILRKMFVFFRAAKVLNLSEKEDGENTNTISDIVHL